MDKPSIEGLRQAFLDGESRIRLFSQLKEEKHSRILNLKVSSNFFSDDFSLNFNDNLNTLIGGRGTGKSTLLEAIRYGLDIPYQSVEAKRRAVEILTSNFSNGKIIIEVFSSRYNKKFTVERNFGQPQIIKNEDGSLSFLSVKDILPEIKMFGQNEIFEFAEKTENHVKLIEQLLPELKDKLPEIQKLLRENRIKLIQTKEILDELETKFNREKQLQERLNNLKALGLDKKFEEQNIYNKEEAIIKRSDSEFKEIQSLVEELERNISAVDLHYLSADALEDYIMLKN
jgi:predicted ATP-dependent endonuclease of OLD family